VHISVSRLRCKRLESRHANVSTASLSDILAFMRCGLAVTRMFTHLRRILCFISSLNKLRNEPERRREAYLGDIKLNQ
jgi:hypothetical protein